MSRRIFVLALVFAGFALVVWSGYQHRRLQPSTPPVSAPVSTADASATQQTDAVTSPLLGKPAPDFALRDLTGHRPMWADFVNAWKTGAEPAMNLARARYDLVRQKH